MNLINKSLIIKLLLIMGWAIPVFPSSVAPESKTVDLQEFEIDFSSNKMTLKQFLDELIKHPELTIVYGNNDLKLDVEIKLSARKLSLKKHLPK